MTTKIALVGARLTVTDHAGILSRDMPGAALQVVCDNDAGRVRSVADACGARDVDTDPEVVIASADVDAVIVAGPDFTHAPLPKACITAGKRMLCRRVPVPEFGGVP